MVSVASATSVRRLPVTMVQRAAAARGVVEGRSDRRSWDGGGLAIGSVAAPLIEAARPHVERDHIQERELSYFYEV